MKLWPTRLILSFEFVGLAPNSEALVLMFWYCQKWSIDEQLTEMLPTPPEALWLTSVMTPWNTW